ncbi:MAG: AAA family ATPase, partial [Candidatus Colwellbacteria bacterium]|nr:AAA family ATPase [Candidatus Colwellbacteria bacterium]
AMLLNRLELQGFKSFPDKISLDLGHRITAVVGPNGSGKSNITDSVRWLLGERDARHLRGGKGEDLIFAGTEKRPRMGLAQATIYFNNSSGFFPYDFKEVAISRRVSRDGESQFFINKAEVRLKDLIDLLAKAKLGARGLTIINQGENDIFIKANPLERRAVIEEILGLKEYQLKKSDAAKKLESTVINLEKARALIEELRPLLRSLKRQVARYEGREVIAGELKQLENSFYGGRLHRLLEELKDSEGKERKLKELLENQNRALKKAETELEKVSLSEPKALGELKTVQSQREKLLSRRRELEKSTAKLEARMELQEKQSGAGTAELQRTVEEIRAIAKPLLEEDELGKLKAGLQRIVSLAERIFASPQSRTNNDSNKEHQMSLRELNALDRELKELSEKENHQRQLLEGFNQNFRKAYGAVESERNKFNELKEEESRVLVVKERVDTKLAGLKEELGQIGLNVEDLKKGEPRIEAELPRGEEETLKRMFKLRSDLAGIGEIDEAIVKEAEETGERYEFLAKQTADLEKAVADLRSLIRELDEKIHSEFSTAVKTINEEFNKFIKLIFGGGKGKLLVLSHSPKNKEDDEAIGNGEKTSDNSGVEIELSLPKKRIKGLEVLSGGERSLVSIAALFALISVSPPPFLVLDEVDAALDEDNARRFSQILKDFSKKTQFVVVTHNRVTMEVADVLYGVTMTPDGTSKVVSLKLA